MGPSVTPAGLLQETRRFALRGFLYAAFLTAFVNAAMLIYPLFMLEVYTRVIPARSLDTLWAMIVVVVLALAVYGVIEFTRAYTWQVLARSIDERLNFPALQAALARSGAAGSAEGVAVVRDLVEVRQFVAGNGVSAPIEAFWSLIFVAVLYLLHPVFGHLAVVCIGLMVALNVATDRLTRRPLRDAAAAQARYVADVGGALRHADAIDAMGMLPNLSRRWRGLHRDLLDAAEMANVRARAVLSFSKAFNLAVQVLTITVGAVLVIERSIPTGSLFVAMILAGRAVQPFGSLIETWRQWVTAAEAWGRVERGIREVASERQTMPVACGDGGLVVDRLTLVPPGADRAVVRQVSFALEPGEVLGVAGPSGAGKSTLARLLVGVQKPTAGGVYLDGHSTYLWERGSFGRAVGYLPQSIAILEGTVRQAIARMDDGDPRLVIRAARAAGVHELIGRLPHGYDTPLAEGGRVLSGGQMQRLALARALYGDPRLIVLDEPNSNLDMEGERALVDAVLAAKARGAMVVMIAHRPSAMAVADRLLVLQDGAVAQLGPRPEILKGLGGEPRPVPARSPVRAIGKGEA